jgi:hypothetical protein
MPSRGDAGDGEHCSGARRRNAEGHALTVGKRRVKAGRWIQVEAAAQKGQSSHANAISDDLVDRVRAEVGPEPSLMRPLSTASNSSGRRPMPANAWSGAAIETANNALVG